MPDVLILASDSPWTWALANAVRRRFGDVPIVVEDKQPDIVLLRRRIRRLGMLTVLGQTAFGVFARAMRLHYRQLEQASAARHGLDPTPIRSGVTKVCSANDARTIDTLRTLAPKIVVISQTRILARRVLESIPAVFINVHTGITPQYRGLHGAYWALAKGDPANCGVSVLVVDPSVDDGPIIAQARIDPSPADNYFTYHWAQLAVALPLLFSGIEDALSGRLVTRSPSAQVESQQYYHPTLWGYIGTGLRRGVW
jgi:methionyl-tRNA formyltransferase